MTVDPIKFCAFALNALEVSDAEGDILLMIRHRQFPSEKFDLIRFTSEGSWVTNERFQHFA
jgi:hypothetical protein